MSEELTISLRPKTFGEVVGASSVLKQLTKIYKKEIPKAVLFYGPTGVGKTTLSRIISVWLQCKHKKPFGYPCRHCYRHRKDFSIRTLNVRERKVEDLERAIEASHNYPMPGSPYRIYIIDEAHMFTDHSQNLLLEQLEDCPETTKWFLCTTSIADIIDTIQSRCVMIRVQGLDLEDVKKLVKRGLKQLNSHRNVIDLAEKLLEKGVTSPRLILRAVQKYANDECTPDEASEVLLASDVDTYSLCRSLLKGDWEDVSKVLVKARNEKGVVKIRRGVSGYLQAILLDEREFSTRTKVIADAILKLNEVGDELPATSAVLWKLCKHFNQEHN